MPPRFCDSSARTRRACSSCGAWRSSVVSKFAATFTGRSASANGGRSPAHGGGSSGRGDCTRCGPVSAGRCRAHIRAGGHVARLARRGLAPPATTYPAKATTGANLLGAVAVS